MIKIFDIIYTSASIFFFPYLLLKGKWHRGMKFRLGNFDSEIEESLKNKKVIWIHAVSVGEVMVIANMVESLMAEYPQHKIVCSTVTKTGNDLAKTYLNKDVLVIFAPLDFSWIVNKFIKRINPEMYIAAETEIWPNIYLLLKQRGTPIIQINGRISDESYEGYKKARFVLKRILNCVTEFCMQSEQDAQRIIELGADQNRVHIVGNLKFENRQFNKEAVLSWRPFYANHKVLIGGSTHPGEEEILVRTYKKLKTYHQNLKMIIAPRHIERAKSVKQLVYEMGFNAELLSKVDSKDLSGCDIVIVDEIGHLRNLYQVATVVFIGKTITGKGGQNMIEPVSVGKPTFVGPNTQNFKDVVRIFKQEDVLIQVSNIKELYSEINMYLSNDDKVRQFSKKAISVVKKLTGARLATMKIVQSVLKVS